MEYYESMKSLIVYSQMFSDWRIPLARLIEFVYLIIENDYKFGDRIDVLHIYGI